MFFSIAINSFVRENDLYEVIVTPLSWMIHPITETLQRVSSESSLMWMSGAIYPREISAPLT